jgi:CheY-like chemotaxis protein
MPTPVKRIPAVRKLVVIIDDDPMVLEATGGLLRSWGCEVVMAASYRDAIPMLMETGRRPDLIVCDYRLLDGETGVEAIEMLRSAFQIPALLISGDSSSPQYGHGSAEYRLLHKPLNAKTFRAMLVETSVLRS